MTPTSHEACIASVAADIRPRLEAIQQAVAARFPQASRCISYQLPAFKGRRVFFYFAAFKHHIGVYPPVTQDADLIRELAPYRGPKGNLSFAHDAPLPLALIERVAQALHREYEQA